MLIWQKLQNIWHIINWELPNWRVATGWRGRGVTTFSLRTNHCCYFSLWGRIGLNQICIMLLFLLKTATKRNEWKHASVLGVILSRYFLNTRQLYIFMVVYPLCRLMLSHGKCPWPSTLGSYSNIYILLPIASYVPVRLMDLPSQGIFMSTIYFGENNWISLH